VIDQLCIEQWNLEEKQQQVQLMRTVYKSYHQCLIWLGEIKQDLPLADAEAAWEIVRYLAFARAKDTKKVTAPDVLRKGQYAVDNAVKALFYTVKRGNMWWNRIWTVQEAALPDKPMLLWGPLTLPWETVILATQTWTRIGCPEPLLRLLTSHHQDILGNLMTNSIWLNVAKHRMDMPLDLISRWRFDELQTHVIRYMGLSACVNREVYRPQRSVTIFRLHLACSAP
jgi:hypothetical protein